MNRWIAFTALCGYLRSGLLGGERPPLLPELSWELLVEVSSHHRVTPALAWCLKDAADIPPEVHDYFNEILALNAGRNKALLAMLARIAAACNAVGIEPVLLKGAARLVDGTYPDTSLRFVGDLDVLIAAERSAEAVAALQARGFRPHADDEALPDGHHHLPMLYDSEAGSGVEIHTDVISGRGAEVVAADWFAAGIQPFAFRDTRVRLPDATRSVAHIVIHDQLLHDGDRRRNVELRQVLDLAMIRARHERAIDWATLDRRFCQAGLGEVLANYLVIAEELFGQETPRLSCAPAPGALEDFRRASEWRRSNLLASIVSLYVALRRRDPGGLLQFFAPRKWPRRIKMIRNALKRHPLNW